MKKIYKISLKVFLLIVFSFCVFNIISSYAAEPIFKITGIAVKEKSTGVTVNDVDLNNDEIINNVLFTDVNDYITYDLKLKNTSSEEYTIKSITDNNNSEYLNYSYDNLSNVVLNAGEEKDLNLTITYIKQATDPNLSVGETNLIITYEKVNGDEGQEEVTPSVNPDQEDKGSPKTGDNVIIYFILGGASLICLILLSKSKKKSNLMIIALAILIPVCVKANSLKLSIKFNNTVKALSYDVEINLDNGSSIIYKSLAKGGKLAQPETPSKRGYSFDNWYLNDAVYDFNSIITGPISLEAKYTKDTYQISYDLDGGSLEDGKSNQTEYDIDSTFTLYNPTKQGYDFVGWRLEGTTETVSTVTISNEVGNKSYKAIYTPKTDTIYHVIHKYRKLNSQEFDEEVFEGRGTTDSVIELDFKPKTGFVNPTSKKKLKILADETASSEYVYEREEYSFTLTDAANVTSDTSNGNYQYGTIINVTANNIDGYTFTKWSNDVTTNTQQITLTGNLTLSPIYTANTDTPYTVVHKYQQVTGDGFDEEVEENTVGTTDTTIDVDYKPRTGFITPTTSKKLTITGDGQAKKEYTYLREEYTFTLEDPDNIVTTDTVSGTYRYGKVINLTAGSKPGHTFTKWSNDVTDASQQITLTNNLTISPVYTPDKYDITFDPDNGNTPSVIKATYGTYITAPSVNPTKEGFTFSYWKLNDVQFDFNNTQITGPITLVAVYTANGDTPYTVKHRYQHIDDDNFDEVIDENTTGTTGDTITVPYKTLTGFVAPTTNQELTITGNGKATKVYEYLREEHTFTLNNIDNLVTSTVSNGTYRYGKEITLTAGSKQGCTFVKWSNNETNATYTFTLTDDVTISPIYTCTVELNPNNGESITYQQVEYGNKVTEPSNNPKKDGYTFNYWMSNDQEYDFDTLVTGPVSLTANYTLDSYTITYVLDGGTLAEGYPQSYDYEHAVNLPSPTKEGYDFDGWMVTGTSEIVSSEIPVHSTGNKSFTAHYTLKEYDITYILNGGSLENGKSNPDTYTINSDITLNNPIKEGFEFTGWTINDGTDLYDTIHIINQTGDVTYKANYEENTSLAIICKKALTLEHATCNATASGKGCLGTGYSAGEDIVFGNINRSDNFAPGDALDCDVDGTGYTKRFYYVRTLDDKAVLIYNTNFQNGTEGTTTNYVYNDALAQLPSTTKWNNLPVTFENNKAARFITLDDLTAMTGKDYAGLKASKSLDDYIFLFHNTTYHLADGRSTSWIKKPENGDVIRIHKDERNINLTDNSSSKNSVRPVIEVPMNQIEDAYVLKFIYGNDPASTNYEFKKVNKGSKIGTLPTYSDSNHIIVGWYKDTNLTNEINENTIPQGYETYYSTWKLKADKAVFATMEYKLSNGTTSTIVILNSDDVEPLTYTSNDENIVTVDSDGIITAHSLGTTTITVEGTYSHTSQTLNVKVSEDTPKVTVSFDTHGGTPVDDIELDINTSIGVMPSSTKDGNTLVGWFNNEEYSVEIKGDNEILADVTLHAKWMPSDTVCEMNNNYYSSVQTAIDNAPLTKTTIKLLNNVEVSTPIDMFKNNTNKDIVLDLNNYTISPSSSAPAKTNIIKTKGKLEIKNGTITSNKTDAVLHVEGSNASLVLDKNVNIVTTGTRAAVYNNGGSVLISGNAYLSANALFEDDFKRGTVQTLGGTTTITGGTIISTTSGNAKGFAVAASGGTVIIGTKDGVSSTSSPVIIGDTYGVRVENGVNIYFYDGIIKAVTAVFENTVIPNSNIEEGYETKTGILEEAEKTYNIFYLSPVNEDIKIQFNAKGGNVDTSYINVTKGTSVSLSDLPTPTNGIYTFDGWYLDEEAETTPVTYPYTPDANTVFYARWVYNSSDEIVSFNINSPAMQTYFANVQAWVSGATKDNNTLFIEALRANFDNNSCSYCSLSADANSCSSPSAGTYCDKAIGKETGITTGITVRESDETTKIKNGPIASYLTISNGTIYNMIPGTTYYWESNSDSNVYGYVKATGNRRTVTTTVRNVRDLGGLEVRFTRNNTTKTGTINYGRLYRGAQLSNGQSDVDGLVKLGVTRELDLRVKTEGTNPVRLPKHDRCNSNCSNISDADDIIMTNYLVNPNTHLSNYLGARKALKATMEFIVNDKDNVYFHCTIGTDRTGTLAYFLEGLLGVGEEDKLEDYELTYYYGLLNRTRFHDELQGSSIKPRFYTMYQTYNTNEKIYDWFMHGRFGGGTDINTLSKSDLLLYASDLEITSVSNSNTEEEIIDAINAQLALDDQLVQDFRDEMITYN